MYHSERTGKIKFEEVNLSYDQFKEFFRDIYEYFEQRSYFREAFKKDFSLLLPNPKAYFFKHTGSLNIYPIDENYQNYDQNTMFTVIEILHRYVQEENDVYGLSTNRIQKKFRDEFNNFLRFLDNGYEITDQGNIITSSNEGIRVMINKDLPDDASNEAKLQVETAIKLFYHYTTNDEQKKKAINILADILEPLRENIKSITYKEHDKMIFGIVNTCKIRHNNEKQLNDYNKDVWYEWMFHYYLSTVHAILRLNN
jgi:hypothetical protein